MESKIFASKAPRTCFEEARPGRRRLVAVKIKMYEDVLLHWHKRIPWEVPPLKGMKISKRSHLRDYNLWHRRRAIALLHDVVGRNRFHLEFVTTLEGKKMSFGDLTAYCIKNFKTCFEREESEEMVLSLFRRKLS